MGLKDMLGAGLRAAVDKGRDALGENVFSLDRERSELTIRESIWRRGAMSALAKVESIRSAELRTEGGWITVDAVTEEGREVTAVFRPARVTLNEDQAIFDLELESKAVVKQRARGLSSFISKLVLATVGGSFGAQKRWLAKQKGVTMAEDELRYARPLEELPLLGAVAARLQPITIPLSVRGGDIVMRIDDAAVDAVVSGITSPETLAAAVRYLATTASRAKG